MRLGRKRATTSAGSDVPPSVRRRTEDMGKIALWDSGSAVDNGDRPTLDPNRDHIIVGSPLVCVCNDVGNCTLERIVRRVPDPACAAMAREALSTQEVPA